MIQISPRPSNFSTEDGEMKRRGKLRVVCKHVFGAFFNAITFWCASRCLSQFRLFLAVCMCAYLAAHNNLLDALTEKDTCDQSEARNNFILKPHQSQSSSKTHDPKVDGIQCQWLLGWLLVPIVPSCSDTHPGMSTCASRAPRITLSETDTLISLRHSTNRLLKGEKPVSTGVC